MKVFFTSDQHFFHINIIRYCQRPFAPDPQGALENVQDLVRRYREKVGPDDAVVFLGDVALANSAAKKQLHLVFNELPGRKFLIMGNHDEFSMNFYKSLGFLEITDHLRIGRHFLCHLPLYAPEDPHPKAARLLALFKECGCDTLWHGHIHTLPSPEGDGIIRSNVCVDYAPNQAAPVEIDIPEIRKFFEDYFQGRIGKEAFAPCDPDLAAALNRSKKK